MVSPPGLIGPAFFFHRGEKGGVEDVRSPDVLVASVEGDVRVPVAHEDFLKHLRCE